MPQLQSLPSELLLAIALHVPQPALSGLALSCRRLNEVLTPLLYESILWQGHYHTRRVFNDEAFFWQHEYFPTECAATRQTDASIIPSSGSRIFDLDAFTRTVLSSESLRSLVRDVDLRWHNKHFNDDDSVRCCLQALESSHLRVLHLSPADFFFEIPARPAVTSLAFQMDSLVEWSYRPHLYARNFERLYTLFCIPSLVHFRLDGRSFCNYVLCEGRAWEKSKSVGASNIEDLSLSSDGAPGDDLREVLSWLKALKNFTFVPHHNPHYEDSATVCGELQHVLQHQRLRLECLHAGVPNCNSGEEKCIEGMIFHWRLIANNRLGHIRIARATGFSGSQALAHLCQCQFTCRARLHIRLDFLVMPQQTMRTTKLLGSHVLCQRFASLTPYPQDLTISSWIL